MATATNARSGRRSARFRQVCDAIGREFRANYLPISAQPIPDELKQLLAQLVALEDPANCKRSGKSLQDAVDQAELAPRD